MDTLINLIAVVSYCAVYRPERFLGKMIELQGLGMWSLLTLESGLGLRSWDSVVLWLEISEIIQVAKLHNNLGQNFELIQRINSMELIHTSPESGHNISSKIQHCSLFSLSCYRNNAIFIDCRSISHTFPSLKETKDEEMEQLKDNPYFNKYAAKLKQKEE